MTAIAALLVLLAPLAAPLDGGTPHLAKYYGRGAYFDVAAVRHIRAHITATTAWGVPVAGFTAIRDDARCTHVYDARPGIGGKTPYAVTLRMYNPVTQAWGRAGRYYVADCQAQQDWAAQDAARRVVPGLGTVGTVRAEVDWQAAHDAQFLRAGVTGVQVLSAPYVLPGWRER